MSIETAAIYLPSRDAGSFTREMLIYDNAETALAQVASVERHLLGDEDNGFGRAPLGVADILSTDPVIAMGMLPHKRLANFQKHSLLAGDVALDDAAQSVPEIEQLIWSCANTMRVVAVGDDAWRVVQMLPVADRRHYMTPPLKLPPPQTRMKPWTLFIINHEAEDRQARGLAEIAAADGLMVACSGLSQTPWHGKSPVTHVFCCPEAAIHVHVGHHTAGAKNFRLIDSWHSGRLAVQWVPPRPPAGWDAENLVVEDEVNGFIRHTMDGVLAICKEMRLDPVLCRKFISAGLRTAEPQARAWSAIAQDLLH